MLAKQPRFLAPSRAEHLHELRDLSITEGPDRVDLSHDKHLQSIEVQTTTVRWEKLVALRDTYGWEIFPNPVG